MRGNDRIFAVQLSFQSYDHEIQSLLLQPTQQEQTVPVPSTSTSSRGQSSLTEKTKSALPVTEKSVRRKEFAISVRLICDFLETARSFAERRRNRN